MNTETQMLLDQLDYWQLFKDLSTNLNEVLQARQDRLDAERAAYATNEALKLWVAQLICKGTVDGKTAAHRDAQVMVLAHQNPEALTLVEERDAAADALETARLWETAAVDTAACTRAQLRAAEGLLALFGGTEANHG